MPRECQQFAEVAVGKGEGGRGRVVGGRGAVVGKAGGDETEGERRQRARGKGRRRRRRPPATEELTCPLDTMPSYLLFCA